MANERIDWEVVLSARTENYDKVTSALTSLQTILGDLANQGDGLDKHFRSAFRSMERAIGQVSSGLQGAEKALHSFGSGVEKVTDSGITQFRKLQNEVVKTTEEMREAAQLHVVAGGTDPRTVASSSISSAQAQEIVAIDEARAVTAESVARQIVAAEDRIQAAKKATIELAREQARATMSEIDALQDKLMYLQREQSIAESQVASAVSRGDRVGEADARENLLRVSREVAQVEIALAREVAAEKNRLEQESADKLRNSLNGSMSVLRQKHAEEKRIAQEARKSEDLLLEAREKRIKQERDAELKAIRDMMQAREELNEIQGGRDYSNLSVNIDEGIDARKREATAFREALQARAASGEAFKEEAKSVNAATNAVKSHGASLPTLRYAMYDVARTATMVSAAITGVGTGVLVASAKYESAFTRVERTSGITGGAVDKLRNQFMDLSREIPQSFDELTNIGARGAQLGVASSQLEEFTRVVAQFVATSDTVTLDESVEAFGRISNLMGDTNFNKIGSAITLVGVNAAATEAQIVKTTQELAPFGTAVGMSTDEVIGLATAMGSLGQPPERARSAFLTLQRVMDTAIADGSENLNAFAQLLGRSVDEVSELWKQDPAEFVSAFSKSLGSVNDLTSAFKALGIHERRAVQVFQALAADARNSAGGISVLDQALRDSAKGYAEGTEMARQYGLILDDLASKWQIFVNSIGELAATVGDAIAPMAKIVVDLATKVVQALSSMARTDAGKFFIQLASSTGLVVAVLAGVLATMATATATMFAMKTVMDGLTASTGRQIISLRVLNAEFTRLAASVRGGTTALRVFKGALASTGVGLAVIAVGTLGEAFYGVGESAEEMFDKFVKSTEGLLEAVSADQQAYQQALADGNRELFDTFTQLPPILDEVSEGQEGYSDAVLTAAEMLDVVLPAIESVNDALGEQVPVIGEATSEWFKHALIASEEFQKLAADPRFVRAWEEMAVDFDEALSIATLYGAEGVRDYFMALIEASDAGADALLSGVERFWHALWQSLVTIGRGLYRAWDSILGIFRGEGMPNLQAGMFQTGWELAELWTSPAMYGPLDKFSEVMAGLADKVRGAGSAAKEAAGGFGGLDEEFENIAGPDGSGGGAGKAIDDVADKLRTVLDYASDLKGVFGRSFQLRFGIEQAEDKTSKILNDIRDAADKAEQKIRDLRLSIKDLNAEIGVMEDDLITQKYFLSIAVEYGDVARQQSISAKIAKLEEDIAGKKNDRAKKEKELADEIENASMRLEGSTNAAIKNRDTILSLVESYEQQLVALAESGASQEELRVAAAKLREEFRDQATALGYSVDEIDKYEQALVDMGTVIEAVPRDVTVEIRGLDAATAALKEFFAKLEHDAAKSGERAGNNIGSGVGGGLSGGSGIGDAKDATFEFASMLGREFNLGFGPVVDPIGVLLGRVQDGLGLTIEQSRFLADSMASETNQGLVQKYDPQGKIQEKLRSGQKLTLREAFILGELLGVESAHGLEARLRGGMPTAIDKGLKAGSNAAKSGGSSLGGTAGSAFNSKSADEVAGARSITSNLSSQAAISGVRSASNDLGRAAAIALVYTARTTLDSLVGTVSKARDSLKKMVGFSSGGFTGRGGVSQPAGVVHRGEYVIPAKDVNQRTGLPNVDALGRLMQGQHAPVRASGGSSSSRGGLSTVALSPGSVQQIANAVRPHLYLDGKEVAQASSSAHVNSSRVGAF